MGRRKEERALTRLSFYLSFTHWLSVNGEETGFGADAVVVVVVYVGTEYLDCWLQASGRPATSRRDDERTSVALIHTLHVCDVHVFCLGASTSSLFQSFDWRHKERNKASRKRFFFFVFATFLSDTCMFIHSLCDFPFFTPAFLSLLLIGCR